MSDFMKATALYHDGKNNVQVNYSGLASKVLLQFKADMENRNVKWAHIFNEGNGKLLHSYQGQHFRESSSPQAGSTD